MNDPKSSFCAACCYVYIYISAYNKGVFPSRLSGTFPAIPSLLPLVLSNFQIKASWGESGSNGVAMRRGLCCSPPSSGPLHFPASLSLLPLSLPSSPPRFQSHSCHLPFFFHILPVPIALPPLPLFPPPHSPSYNPLPFSSDTTPHLSAHPYQN